MFEIRLFGAVEILREGQAVSGFRSQKTLALLAYLIVEDRPLARDTLAGLLWPETTQSDALGHLRRALYNLSSLLPDCLDVDRRTARFSPEAPAQVDLHTFRHLSNEKDSKSWEQAVALAQAPFLEGLYLDDCPELESWITVERERWSQAVAQLLEILIEQRAAATDYETALSYARHLIRFEPWRESTHRRLMLLLARIGQRDAALAQYQRCRQAMEEELGLAVSAQTTELYERIRNMPQPSHNLPGDPTPFTGRAEQLARLETMLRGPHARLITLRGPGGVGKTRLAVETARRAAPAFLEGVWFVDLVGVKDAGQMVTAIAAATGLPLRERSDPRAQLLDYVRDKELLLVLDNFEQLLEARRLLSDILQAAPEVKLLVTSRRDLALRLEQIFPVEGLVYPGAQWEDEGPAKALQTEAVRFLVEATRRYRPGFQPDEELASFIEICRLVEGSPLALELAAASLHGLPVAQVAQAVAKNLDILQSRHGDVAPRHRSVRAAFDHSWHLLADVEKQALLGLSVFSGGFTPEAAQEVAGIRNALLQALVNHSLIRLSEKQEHGAQSQIPRYTMHELLHQYGQERLALAPAMAEELALRHARYCLGLVAGLDQEPDGRHEIETRHLFGAEHDNILAAWRAATDHGCWRLLLGSLDALARNYLHQGRAQAALAPVELALDGCRQEAKEVGDREEREHLQRRLMAVKARLLVHSGRYEEGLQIGEVARKMAGESGDSHTAVAAAYACSLALFNQGEHEESRSKAERALDLCRASGAKDGCARYEGLLLNMVGRTWLESDRARARRHFEQALDFSHSRSYRLQTAALINLSLVDGSEGRYAQAARRLEAALALARDNDYRELLGTIHLNAGTMAFHQGLYPEGKEHYQAALAVYRQSGDRAKMGIGYHSRAVVAAEEGLYREAHRDVQLALEIYRATGSRFREGALQMWLGHLQRILGRFEQAHLELTAAQRLFKELEARVQLLESCWRLGWLYSDSGNFLAAEEQLQKADALPQDQIPPEVAGWTLLTWSRVLYAQKELPGARAKAEEALGVARSANPRLVPECTVHAGHVLTAMGELAAAKEHYEETIAIREKWNQRHLAMEARAGLAQVALLQGEDDRAARQASTVLSFLDEAGAWQKIFGVQQPFQTLHTCYAATADVDNVRAEGLRRRMREEAARRAERLEEGHREKFLEKVASCRAAGGL